MLKKLYGDYPKDVVDQGIGFVASPDGAIESVCEYGVWMKIDPKNPERMLIATDRGGTRELAGSPADCLVVPAATRPAELAGLVRALANRIGAFVALPVATLDRISLQQRLTEIGHLPGAAA